MSRYANPEDDPQFAALHGVLVNSKGITDPKELDREVMLLSADRLLELESRALPGNFDISHLRAVHGYIYQDIFPWAGEFRTVDTARTSSFGFAHAAHIPGSLATIFAELAAERHLHGLDRSRFVERAAYYLGEINAVHPFRDGNGRSGRELIRSLALEAGYVINWAGLTKEEIDRAARFSFSRRDNRELTHILDGQNVPRIASFRRDIFWSSVQPPPMVPQRYERSGKIIESA